jgi:hypothetical protein
MSTRNIEITNTDLIPFVIGTIGDLTFDSYNIQITKLGEPVDIDPASLKIEGETHFGNVIAPMTPKMDDINFTEGHFRLHFPPEFLADTGQFKKAALTYSLLPTPNDESGEGTQEKGDADNDTDETTTTVEGDLTLNGIDATASVTEIVSVPILIRVIRNFDLNNGLQHTTTGSVSQQQTTDVSTGSNISEYHRMINDMVTMYEAYAISKLFELEEIETGVNPDWKDPIQLYLPHAFDPTGEPLTHEVYTGPSLDDDGQPVEPRDVYHGHIDGEEARLPIDEYADDMTEDEAKERFDNHVIDSITQEVEQIRMPYDNLHDSDVSEAIMYWGAEPFMDIDPETGEEHERVDDEGNPVWNPATYNFVTFTENRLVYMVGLQKLALTAQGDVSEMEDETGELRSFTGFVVPDEYEIPLGSSNLENITTLIEDHVCNFFQGQPQADLPDMVRASLLPMSYYYYHVDPITGLHVKNEYGDDDKVLPDADGGPLHVPFDWYVNLPRTNEPGVVYSAIDSFSRRDQTVEVVILHEEGVEDELLEYKIWEYGTAWQPYINNKRVQYIQSAVSTGESIDSNNAPLTIDYSVTTPNVAGSVELEVDADLEIEYGENGEGVIFNTSTGRVIRTTAEDGSYVDTKRPRLIADHSGVYRLKFDVSLSDGDELSDDAESANVWLNMKAETPAYVTILGYDDVTRKEGEVIIKAAYKFMTGDPYYKDENGIVVGTSTNVAIDAATGEINLTQQVPYPQTTAEELDILFEVPESDRPSTGGKVIKYVTDDDGHPTDVVEAVYTYWGIDDWYDMVHNPAKDIPNQLDPFGGNSQFKIYRGGGYTSGSNVSFEKNTQYSGTYIVDLRKGDMVYFEKDSDSTVVNGTWRINNITAEELIDNSYLDVPTGGGDITELATSISFSVIPFPVTDDDHQIVWPITLQDIPLTFNIYDALQSIGFDSIVSVTMSVTAATSTFHYTNQDGDDEVLEAVVPTDWQLNTDEGLTLGSGTISVDDPDVEQPIIDKMVINEDYWKVQETSGMEFTLTPISDVRFTILLEVERLASSQGGDE